MDKKHLKKAAAAAAALLLALLLPMAGAFAASASVSSQQITVPAGTATFSFDVRLGGVDTAFASLQYLVDFDEDVLSLDRVTAGPAAAGSTEQWTTRGGGREVKALGNANGSNVIQPMSGEAVMHTLTFSVRSGALASGISAQIRLYDMKLIRVYSRPNADFGTESEQVAFDATVSVTKAADSTVDGPGPGPGGGDDGGTTPGGGDDGGTTPGGGNDGGTTPGGGNDGGTTPGGGSDGGTTPGGGNDGGTTPGGNNNNDTTDVPGGQLNAPPGTSYGDDGRITIPAGSDGATLTLPDGSTIFVPGGYTMIPDDAQPGGYAIVFDNPFTDVSESDWFYGDVEYVFTRGLFKGTSATEFAPHMDVTRGMLITVLGRLHGVNEAEHQGASFDDVAPGAYYAAYVKWGFDNGLVLGVGENRYEPDRAIKREELAAIFSRYAAFINFEMPATREAPAFADEDEISGYAKEAIGQMYRAGIINGMGDDVIAPGAAATRAQMAAMVHRFALLVGLLD